MPVSKMSGTAYNCDSFSAAVREGLKLLNLTSCVELSSHSSVLPKAPVVYAEVVGGAGDFQPVALVPLQLLFVSIKVCAQANLDSLPSSVRVKFKARWHLKEQYEDCPLVLAVPVGFRGTSVGCEMKVSDFFQSKMHREELGSCRPQSENFYLLSLPAVKTTFKNGTALDVVVNYLQDFNMIDNEHEHYSFTVPLSIPSYVTHRRRERVRNEKIRVVLECRGPGSIRDCYITSHSMLGIITKDKKRVLLRESDGYSDKDLECSCRITSSTMGQPKLFIQESSFIRAVEDGLRLICGIRGMSSPLQSVLPTAPMLYAVVSDVDLLDIETARADLAFQLPALVPLQMTWLSVKVDAEPKPDSVHVRFKGEWSTHCIKKGNYCPLVLAVPVGHRGRLLRYEIRLPPHRHMVKTEEFSASSGPHLQNLYLLALPPVEGGADVYIQFHYVQDVIKEHGVFSFNVPLSVPCYISRAEGKSSRKERIRLTLECRDCGTFKDCKIPSHQMMELISEEKMRVFQQESLSFSSNDLTCSFKVI